MQPKAPFSIRNSHQCVPHRSRFAHIRYRREAGLVDPLLDLRMDGAIGLCGCSQAFVQVEDKAQLMNKVRGILIAERKALSLCIHRTLQSFCRIHQL